jgi:hypothetical protein
MTRNIRHDGTIEKQIMEAISPAGREAMARYIYGL